VFCKFGLGLGKWWWRLSSGQKSRACVGCIETVFKMCCNGQHVLTYVKLTVVTYYILIYGCLRAIFKCIHIKENLRIHTGSPLLSSVVLFNAVSARNTRKLHQRNHRQRQCHLIHCGHCFELQWPKRRCRTPAEQLRDIISSSVLPGERGGLDTLAEN